MDFIVFHDIADIAGADPKALGSGYGVLGSDGSVFYRKKKISGTGFSGIAAGNLKGLIPFLKICAEDKDHLSLCDKGLIVAGNGKPFFQILAGNIQNSIHLLIPGSRSFHCGTENLLFALGRDFLICVGTYGFSFKQAFYNFIQSNNPPDGL